MFRTIKFGSCFQLLEFEESLEALERQVAELKRRNEELSEENGRRARKDDETASLMSSQRAKQEEQVQTLSSN